MIIHERVPFFGFAIVALLLPFIGLQAGLSITFILLTWQGLGGGFTANSWTSMISKIIPSERRGTFFGLQAGIANLFISGSAMAAGYLLDHLGCWRLQEDSGVNRGASNFLELNDNGKSGFLLRVIHGATAWKSSDPDTSRIWWSEVGVTQNLTHAVHPDPVSGVHCWLQKATHVRKANADEKAGDVFIDTNKSMEKYREWLKLALPRRPGQPPMAREDHIGSRVLSNQQKRRINYRNDRGCDALPVKQCLSR